MPGVGLVLKNCLFTLCPIEFKLVMWLHYQMTDAWPKNFWDLSDIALNSQFLSLKPSSRSWLFPVAENLIVWFTATILLPCPRAQSFPNFPRENCTNHLLASKNWLDITQLWSVVISCPTQHSWFTILLGSTTSSLSLSHMSYSLPRGTNMPFLFV